jgi:hypothetical protein
MRCDCAALAARILAGSGEGQWVPLPKERQRLVVAIGSTECTPEMKQTSGRREVSTGLFATPSRKINLLPLAITGSAAGQQSTGTRRQNREGSVLRTRLLRDER